MNEKYLEINTLKEFADFAGDEITIWKLLIGVSIEKISHFNNVLLINQNDELQPIEGLSNTDNFLKVQLRGTFKKLSGFYSSARRCNRQGVINYYNCKE